jgi:hypothetical protein
VGTLLLASFTAFEPNIMIPVGMTMVLFVALPIAASVDVRHAATFSLRQMFFVVTCLAVYISMLRNPWPFRLRFAVSRPALAEFALRFERGETLEGGQWAGCDRCSTIPFSAFVPPPLGLVNLSLVASSPQAAADLAWADIGTPRCG